MTKLLFQFSSKLFIRILTHRFLSYPIIFELFLELFWRHLLLEFLKYDSIAFSETSVL